MALKNGNRVQETSTTTGTGTYSLAGATALHQTFVAEVGSTHYCRYLAADSGGWELGIGLVTSGSPDTLARTVILESSNAGAAVNWAAGTRTISCVATGEQATQFLVGHAVLGSAAASIGPFIAPVGVTRLWGTTYVIAPGALVPRILLGGAAIDTGTVYASANGLANANLVNAASLRGLALNVAAMASGDVSIHTFNIVKPAAANVARGQWSAVNGAIVAATAPLLSWGGGHWVNSTDLMQRIELHGYSAITGTTDANMSAGSEILVYGSFEP